MFLDKDHHFHKDIKQIINNKNKVFAHNKKTQKNRQTALKFKPTYKRQK
jgi:hypothetical protein